MTTTPSLAQPPASLDDAVVFVSDLVARGGPARDEYPIIDALMRLLPALSAEDVNRLRDAFGDAVYTSETMQGFAFTKPHGYAGDYEIIDRIYAQRISANPQLAAWDHYFHVQPASRAVRNRKDYFQALLSRHAARRRPLRVLNLASGPGRCMAEWLDANPTAEVTFTCVELDAAAIAHARELTRASANRVTFVRENLLRYNTAERFDLIWAAGVCDYFSEQMFARMLRRYLNLLTPGGELVAGNFSEANPNRNYMEILGEWRLHHRPAETLRRIAQNAGARSEAVSIGAEPEGVNLFLHVAAPSAQVAAA
jgi:SAM-dependent methyltransferase